MSRHSLPVLLVSVLIIMLTAGCHKQETPPPVASSGAASSNPHIAPQMQQGRMTRINGMQAAARQRAQMMHRASGKP